MTHHQRKGLCKLAMQRGLSGLAWRMVLIIGFVNGYEAAHKAVLDWPGEGAWPAPSRSGEPEARG